MIKKEIGIYFAKLFSLFQTGCYEWDLFSGSAHCIPTQLNSFNSALTAEIGATFFHEIFIFLILLFFSFS